MNLINITATNFLSFKELNYKFEKVPILIQGENLTDDSQESNGSGKSTLQMAIEYALFKTSIKDRDIDLIFWGEEKADVKLTIYCPVRNETLVIWRAIKLKGSSELELYVNSDYVSFATVIDGNNYILQWLGISREDLQNYFIINKERYKSFFSSSNKEKIEMINRFSNAKIIAGIDKLVQADVDKLNVDLGNYNTGKTSLISKVRTLNEQITVELNRDIKKEIQAEIDELENDIERKKESIQSCADKISGKDALIALAKESILSRRSEIRGIETTISERGKSLEEVYKTLVAFNDVNHAKEYSELAELEQEILDSETSYDREKIKLNQDQREIDELLMEINMNITGSVTCPKCAYEFVVGDPTVDVEQEKQAKVETEAVVERIKKSITDIYSEIEKLNSQKTEVNLVKLGLKKEEDAVYAQKQKIKEKIEGIETEIIELKRKVEGVNTLILNLDRSIKSYEFDIKTIKENQYNYNQDILRIKNLIEKAKERDIDLNRIKEIQVQMRGEGSKLRDLNYSIRRKKKQIFETAQWIVNFKRFDMFLANNSLKIIQGYCNKFLQSIKSDIQIRWEGKKILADGTLKDEITPFITRNMVTKSFWSYSGGERVRLDYSMILTLQRMINATHKYGGLDFLSLDEVGEGMDALGLEELMKSLSIFEKTILITTHVVNRNISDKILLIRKINGESIIVN